MSLQKFSLKQMLKTTKTLKNAIFKITKNLHHTKVNFNNNKNTKWALASEQMERNFKRQAAD